MLNFTRLKLHGFKSFVERSDLLIEEGMTGIVGPNGCGKSNLVEALRWVMGETSARRMRGSAMDDVIFGGTSLRPARNVAEVVLELDNRERRATAEFNHHDLIEVTRRIEREGGSDYLINGKPVRQRDVQLLFADLATGAHSTSLVGQGQIDALIRAKPQDRRQILEEASGTSGLQARRHEAELKLRAAEQNLTRADDVLSALDQQWRSLKSQVKQASRYRNVLEHIRRSEALLLHLRWVAAEQQAEQSQIAIMAAETAVNEALAVVTRSTTERTEAAALLPDLRQAEAIAAATVQRLTLARDQIEHELRRVTQATEQQRQRLAQTETDKAREELMRRDAEAALERLAVEQEKLAQLQLELAAEQPQAEAALTEITAQVAEQDKQLSTLTAEIAQAEAKRDALARRATELQQRAQKAAQRREELLNQQSQLQAEQAARPDLALAQSMIEACIQDVERREALKTTAENDRQMAESTLQQANATYRQSETAAMQLRAEAEAISTLLKGADFSGEPVLDLLQVEAGLEAALAAALGEALAAPLQTEAGAHWRALPDFVSPPTLPAGVLPLSQHVSAPPALARALSQIGLVTDPSLGESLLPDLQAGQCLVSRDGWAWRWDGYTVTPAAPAAAAVRLQQRNRLTIVQDELKIAASNLAEAQATVAAAEQKRQEVLAAEQAAQQGLQQAYRALNDARSHHAALVEAGAVLASRLTAVQEALTHGAQDDTALQEQIVANQAEQTLLPDIFILKNRQDALRLTLAEQRQVQIERRGKLDHTLRESKAVDERLRLAAGDQKSWRQRLQTYDQQLATLAARHAECLTALAELEQKPASLTAERATLLTEGEAADAARAAATETLLAAETQLTQWEQQLKRDEAALAEARENRVRAEAAIAAAAENQRVLTEIIAEKLQCAPSEVLAQAEHDPAEAWPETTELEARLAKYCRERDAMGPVNLRAETEAATVEADITKLQTEKDDLVNAISRLRQGIQQLNKEARERLDTAFQQVDERFQILFKRLFGGGKAHLQLQQADDPLNAGLEIYAAPPGKKVQILSLLSGGERSLTALALLFAVFQTNPSPICVLDEAEAALDEGNVDRFCSLVADIARETKTRFLVITHQRLTMARMDRLFGVTMSEKGVSQLVSVDLAQAEAVRDGLQPEAALVAA
jgi:chromosome segregation protein